MANTDFNRGRLHRDEARSDATDPSACASIIRKAIPSAVEGISYQIPAYKVDVTAALYFAG